MVQAKPDCMNASGIYVRPVRALSCLTRELFTRKENCVSYAPASRRLQSIAIVMPRPTRSCWAAAVWTRPFTARLARHYSMNAAYSATADRECKLTMQ